MRYKFYKMLKDKENFQDVADLGNHTCKKPDDVVSLVKEMKDKYNLDYVAKRKVDGWGMELFFHKEKEQ